MRYTNEITETAPPITESDLKRIEKKLGFVFPDEIKSHYLEFNGGVLARTWFDGEEVAPCVAEILPILHGEKGDTLDTVCKDLRNDDRVIPQHLIPFAADDFGDYFCFSVKPEEPGAIYFFVGEHYDPDDPEAAPVRLTNTLREFIEALKVEED